MRFTRPGAIATPWLAEPNVSAKQARGWVAGVRITVAITDRDTRRARAARAGRPPLWADRPRASSRTTDPAPRSPARGASASLSARSRPPGAAAQPTDRL